MRSLPFSLAVPAYEGAYPHSYYVTQVGDLACRFGPEVPLLFCADDLHYLHDEWAGALWPGGPAVIALASTALDEADMAAIRAGRGGGRSSLPRMTRFSAWIGLPNSLSTEPTRTTCPTPGRPPRACGEGM